MARIGFTPAPGVDVSDADAAVGEVKSPKTFYSVAAPRKTGTMPTKAIVAANDLYEEGYHAGNPGGLDAIDTDLAPANIKSGVTIFGKVGSYAPTLIDDTSGTEASALTGTQTTDHYALYQMIEQYEELDLVSKVLTFAAGSRAVAVGVAHCAAVNVNSLKGRLYMAGVEVAESAYLPVVGTASLCVTLVGIAALSGSQTCKLSIYSYEVERYLWVWGGKESGHLIAAGIGIGSIKT